MHLSCWKHAQYVKKNVWGVKILWLYGFNNSVGISFHWNRSTIAHGSKDLESKQTGSHIANNEDRSDHIISFETNKLILMNDISIELVTSDVFPFSLSLLLAHSLSFYLYVWCATNSFQDFLLHFRMPKQINRKKYYISAFNWWQCIPVCVYQNSS